MKNIRKYRDFITEGLFSREKKSVESDLFDEIKKIVIEKKVTIYFIVNDILVQPKVRKITNLTIDVLDYIITIDFDTKKAIYNSKELNFDNVIECACELIKYYDLDATDGRLYKLMDCKETSDKEKDAYWNEMIQKYKDTPFSEKIVDYCKKFYLVSEEFFKKNTNLIMKMDIDSLFGD